MVTQILAIILKLEAGVLAGAILKMIVRILNSIVIV